MSLGYFGLVLHGHIPWCKKSGIWPAGEEWLMKVMSETYVPLLNVLRELREMGVKKVITINITPILAEQLADDYMKQRFTEYMENLISRAKNDIGLNTNFGYTLKTGVSVFGRNTNTSRQVWDSKIGYPGDANYREFHRKDPESGLHYWKITNKSFPQREKQLYNPEIAQETVKSHANHFVTFYIMN